MLQEVRPVGKFTSDPNSSVLVTGEYNGRPYRGLRTLIRENDPDNMKPQLQYEAHTKVFDLSQPEAPDQLSQTMTEIRKHGYECTVDKQFCQDTHNWRILLIWVEDYYTCLGADNGQTQQ